MVRKRRRSKQKQDIEQQHKQPQEVGVEKEVAKTEKTTKDTMGSETTGAKTATSKTTAKKKDSFGARIKMFFREVRAELRKVSWPDKERTTNSTLVVIFTLIVLAICMTVFTVIFTRLADYFFKIPSVTG